MNGKTGIEWTESTWNPVTGCSKVSPGCDNCYAAALAKRLKAMGNPRYQKDGPDGPGFGVTLHADKLDEPHSWKAPRSIFVNSMSDLFHASVPEWFVDRVLTTIEQTSQHRYQVLTKRPRRAARVFSARYGERCEAPSNLWLGCSVESADYVWRVDHLRDTPAQVRFLSLEPLLGPLEALDLNGIDWVIVGGESGAHHRRVAVEWVRMIRDACLDAGVPFFFKQWGGRTPKSMGRELDGRVWSEMPKANPRQTIAVSAATGAC